MATTLLQKLKDALKKDDLNADVKGDVLVEMLTIIATNNCCSMGLVYENKKVVSRWLEKSGKAN